MLFNILKTGTTVLLLCLLGGIPFRLAGVEADPQPTAHSGLSAYLERALESNPGLSAFRHRYEAAMARIPAARALPEPRLQVTHFVESVETRTGPQENILALTQQIPWFGTLEKRGHAARADSEALWFALQDHILAVARETGSTYFAYALLERQLELVRRNLDLLEQGLPSVEEQVRGGSSIDQLLRLQVETGRLGDRIASLESERAVVATRLRELLALPAKASLPPATLERTRPPRADPDSLLPLLESANPALAILRRRIDSAEAREALARLESRPDFTLGINYIQVGDTNAPSPDPGRDAWGITLNIDLPLWFSANRSARLQATHARRSLEADYEQKLLFLQGELDRHLHQLRNASRTAALYEETLLGLARQSVEISRSRYTSGQGSILAWIDSERSLLDLELTYWEAVAEIATHQLALQVLVNQPVAGIPLTQTQP